MSAARVAILKAVAKALPRNRPDVAIIAAEARMLMGDPQTLRPILPESSLVESFVQRVSASKAGATVDCVTKMEDLPAAVALHLAKKELAARIALQPSPVLTGLNWAEAGLALDGPIDDGIVVGLARWGIAENGSLVVHSASDTPILLSFLPALHIVAVLASSIVAYLEDYSAAARHSRDPAPRNVCLITGASGTTDIEGNLVLGAHGPRELHIVVIDDSSLIGGAESEA